MTADIFDSLMWLVVALNVASAGYVLAAIFCVGAFRRPGGGAGTFRPPVTILKPVCGLDEALYENLRSFCRQDYPAYQVVFGVLDSADPAIPVIERLKAELPDIDIDLVIDGRVAGDNLKVSNLANMARVAKHDLFFIADSDMRVDESYLSAVVAPFAEADVGAVTCLYKGTSDRRLASRLAAMFINEGFLPSVLVSARLRPLQFCFGATMAVRRALLETIGGFTELSRYLADDHMLGKLVGAQGYRIALSPYIVEDVVSEASFSHMFHHELRWSRTVRTVEPVGHAFSFIMYGLPLALIGALLAAPLGHPWLALGLIGAAVLVRAGLHLTVRRKLDLPKDGSLWLVPLRDIVSFAVWGASLLGRHVEWRGRPFVVRRDGFIVAKKGSAP